jgi:glycosyltransferase involved in cell wall biosynthesis
LLLTDSTIFAGTERHMLDLATGLVQSGIEAMIGCPTCSQLADRARSRGLETIVFDKPSQIGLGTILLLRKLLLSGRFDLIHVHNGKCALQAAIAIRLAGRGQLILTQHFLQPRRVGRSGLRRTVSDVVHQWLRGQIAHYVAISAAVRVQMLARGDCPAGSVTTVLNGITDPRGEGLGSVDEVRCELDLHRGAPVVMCASRLEPEKGVATLIEAMALVIRTVPDAVCIVAGEGRLRGELEELGFRTDVMSIMNACDLFVLPCPVEGFGLVLVEAMSLGKPVIATAAGGPLEIVDDGGTGLLVPPGNSTAMAGAIERLLRSPQIRGEMGMRGLEKYRAEFTVERMAQETIGVYRRVLAGPAKWSSGAVPASASA